MFDISPPLFFPSPRSPRPLHQTPSLRERRRPRWPVTRGPGGPPNPWGPRNDRKSRTTLATNTISRQRQIWEGVQYHQEISPVRGPIIRRVPPNQPNPLATPHRPPVTPSNHQPPLPHRLFLTPDSSKHCLKMFLFAACCKWHSNNSSNRLQVFDLALHHLPQLQSQYQQLVIRPPPPVTGLQQPPPLHRPTLNVTPNPARVSGVLTVCSRVEISLL